MAAMEGDEEVIVTNAFDEGVKSVRAEVRNDFEKEKKKKKTKGKNADCSVGCCSVGALQGDSG